MYQVNKWPINCQQEGLALPVVLWVILLISLLFASYSYSVRTELSITKQLIQASKNKHVAEVALQQTIFFLMSDSKNSKERTQGVRTFQGQLNGIDYQSVAVNHKGLISINSAQTEVLESLLQSYIVNSEKRSRIIDGILNWRNVDEKNQEVSSLKKNSESYDSGQHSNQSSGKFLTLDQLLLIPGIDNELYNRVAGLFTTKQQGESLNPSLAPYELLLALSNGSPERVNSFLEDRESNNSSFDGLDGMPASKMTSNVSNIWTIEIEVNAKKSTVTRLTTIVKIVDSIENPYTLLSARFVDRLYYIQ
jgi:general secretion pathway protein K